jgi:diguanylate cyclase (GGDEF)-like protein/PAS domain S-box-containing protein
MIVCRLLNSLDLTLRQKNMNKRVISYKSMSKKNYKSNKIIKLCAVALVFVWQCELFAIGDPLLFRAIGKEQGLSQSSIIETFQSSDGYIWLATQDGLNRYDGYEIKIYKHEATNPHSISDNFIWSIAEDAQGNMWIGTAEGGVNRFDPKTEIFTHYLHLEGDTTSLSDNQVLDILVDSQNRVWIATAIGGLNLYQPQQDSFIRFKNTPSKPNTINSNTIKVVKEAPDGKLWLGYSHAPFIHYPGAGFSIFDPETSKNKAFTTEQGLSDNSVTDILPAEGNSIWISTYRGGLNLFNTETQEFKKIPLPSELKSIRIMSMAKDSSGNLWLAQIDEGLIELDSKTLETFNHRPNQSESLTLNHNSVSHVYIHSGIIWVGTWQKGLNISNFRGRQFGKLLSGFSQKNGLTEGNVTHISRSEKTGDIWLANSSALLQYDHQFNLLHRYLVQDLLPYPKAKTVRFVFADSSGNIWFNCAQLGLFKLIPPSSNSSSLFQVQDFRHLVNIKHVLAMAELSPNRFAIGSRNKGLFILDVNKNEFSNLTIPSANQEVPNNNAITKNSIVHDPILNGWWVATLGGGINFLSNNDELSLLPDLNSVINQKRIKSILPIDDNILWLGTQGKGLYRLQWKDKRQLDEAPEIQVITEKNGLASSTIGHLAVHGNDIWASTTQGISVIESKTKIIRNLDLYDGVLPGYSVGVGEKVNNETIIFGGFNGASYFYPKDFVPATNRSNTVINQLLIESKVALISEDRKISPLQNHQIQYTHKLNFHYMLSHFTLGFTALDYIKPEAIKYAYRLKGFNSEWQYTDSSRRFATYTNLDSGNYTFELKSTDHFGQWNDKIVSLPISVEPRPWRTWWAYLGYVLTALLIGTSFLNQRIKQINAIKERNEQLSVTSKLFENTSEGVILFDYSHRVALINEGYTKITGYRPNEIIGKKINLPLIDLQKQGLFEDILSKVTKGEKWQGELWAQRKSGEIFPVEIIIDEITSHHKNDHQRDQSGHFQHVAIWSDITQRKESENKLQELAFFDELTLLPNRRNFEGEVQNEIDNNIARDPLPFSVIFIDLDNFKSINDSLGHNVGDKFLQELAVNFRIAVEKRVTIARLGGDEFLIFVPNAVIKKASLKGDLPSPEEVITKIAEDILDIVMQPFEIGEYKLRVSCSIGIAIYPQHGITFERLLRNADTAMYEAKKNVHQKIICYNEQMNVLARQQFEVAEQIRDDIKNKCFLPYYQIKADAKTGKTIGLEVLARWNNQKLGWINPTLFIPIAEERGLINTLFEQIFETACLQILPLIQQGKFEGRMAINLSPVQFQQLDIVDKILSIIERTQFPIINLEIEVTESVAILDSHQALVHMERIRKLGAHLSLDDFGTGYSSLSYLHKFPLDSVKIDRSFVTELMTNSDNQKVTSAIINMSHSLGMTVIAEGVENEQQLKFLQEVNCDFIQGFFLHKPCNIETLISFIESKPKFF